MSEVKYYLNPFEGITNTITPTSTSKPSYVCIDRIDDSNNKVEFFINSQTSFSYNGIENGSLNFNQNGFNKGLNTNCLASISLEIKKMIIVI